MIIGQHVVVSCLRRHESLSMVDKAYTFIIKPPNIYKNFMMAEKAVPLGVDTEVVNITIRSVTVNPRLYTPFCWFSWRILNER